MAAPARGWQPANDPEREMLRAISAGDQTGYFKILASTPLYLVGNATPQAPQQLATWQRDGATYLLVFTSLESLAHCVGAYAEAYWTTNYAELVRTWPDPTWKLAVDPTVPIGAFLSVDDIVRGAAGDVTVPTVDDFVTEATGTPPFRPANDLERAWNAAVHNDDTETFLDMLVAAAVLVCPARPVPDPDAIRRPGFPWRVETVDGVPTIAVFTSLERLAQAHPADAPTVTVDFVAVALAWPDPLYRLSVNPGCVLSMDFPGAAMGELIDWARELAYRQLSSDTSDPDGEKLLVEAVAVPADIDRYLREGHARATGLVGPAGGFSADETIHVLRWQAHCPELYQEGPDDLLVVDELALPHGAQLVRIEPSGPETQVATYDADLRRWDFDVGGRDAERPGVPDPEEDSGTIRDGCIARWRGTEYEASPDGALIRLYAPTPTQGFRAVYADRYLRLIAADEAEWFGYLRTQGVWHGQPVIVLAEGAAGWLVSATDDQTPEGLRHDWVHRAQVIDLNEQRFPVQ